MTNTLISSFKRLKFSMFLHYYCSGEENKKKKIITRELRNLEERKKLF